MIYNPISNTNDFPIISDFYTKFPNTNLIKPRGIGLGAVSAFERNAEMNELMNALNIWGNKYNVPRSVIDEWVAKENELNTPEKKLNFWERVKKSLNDAKNNIVTTTQNISQNISEAVNNVVENVKDLGGDAVLIPLAPYLPLMRLALRNANKPQGENLKDTATLFFHIIVKKESDFNLNYHYALKKARQTQHFVVTTALVLAVLPVVMEILKTINLKKKNGTATKEESDLYDTVQKSVEETVKNDTKPKESKKGMFVPLLVSGLGLAVLIAFVKKK